MPRKKGQQTDADAEYRITPQAERKRVRAVCQRCREEKMVGPRYKWCDECFGHNLRVLKMARRICPPRPSVEPSDGTFSLDTPYRKV